MIGIAIGLVLGLAIVIFFVFVLSRDAIDDPSLPSEPGVKERTAPEPAGGP